jgi:Alginate export
VDFYHHDSRLLGVDSLKISFEETAEILPRLTPESAAGGDLSARRRSPTLSGLCRIQNQVQANLGFMKIFRDCVPILLATCAGLFAQNAIENERASSGDPFQAYPWFPVPDALTREQPDGALAGPPDVTPPPYALFRDADYDPAWGSSRNRNLFNEIKLVPLDRERLIYLTLGGIRERFEYWNNENFGVVPGTVGEDAYWLERIMLHLDLRIGPYLRLFVQGKSNLEQGRKDGPRPMIDVDQIDLHQAFVDINIPISSDGWFTLRAGRQELGYGIGRHIDPREALF